jgi:RNA polymerase sigma-70 factor (ECF subfamily)
MTVEAEPAAMLPEDELKLIERCQNGDTSAFNELVTRYRQRAFAMIYHMVRNEQDAWDLTQDGFLKAWKSINRFRGQSSFYTWLYRILTNITIDWLRKKQIESGAELNDEVDLDVAPGAVTVPHQEVAPGSALTDKEIRARIDEAIARLSPEHRAVVVLREIDGLEYQEIADHIGCSLGTVMSRLFYARKKLQSMLKDVYANL